MQRKSNRFKVIFTITLFEVGEIIKPRWHCPHADAGFEPWLYEAEHVTSRLQRLPTILFFIWAETDYQNRGWSRKLWRDRQAALTTTPESEGKPRELQRDSQATLPTTLEICPVSRCLSTPGFGVWPKPTIIWVSSPWIYPEIQIEIYQLKSWLPLPFNTAQQAVYGYMRCRSEWRPLGIIRQDDNYRGHRWYSG